MAPEGAIDSEEGAVLWFRMSTVSSRKRQRAKILALVETLISDAEKLCAAVTEDEALALSMVGDWTIELLGHARRIRKHLRAERVPRRFAR